MNAAKTKSMLFHSNRNFQHDNELLIFLNGQEIERVSCFKCLGIHMDPHLSFDNHIDAITRRVNQRTRLLWKMHSFIDTNLALDLYMSLIETLFLCFCHVYDGTSNTNSNHLQVLQNNALWAVMEVDNRYTSSEMHSSLEVEWLDITRKHLTCAELYKLV